MSCDAARCRSSVPIDDQHVARRAAPRRRRGGDDRVAAHHRHDRRRRCGSGPGCRRAAGRRTGCPAAPRPGPTQPRDLLGQVGEPLGDPGRARGSGASASASSASSRKAGRGASGSLRVVDHHLELAVAAGDDPDAVAVPVGELVAHPHPGQQHLVDVHAVILPRRARRRPTDAPRRAAGRSVPPAGFEPATHGFRKPTLVSPELRGRGRTRGAAGGNRRRDLSPRTSCHEPVGTRGSVRRGRQGPVAVAAEAWGGAGGGCGQRPVGSAPTALFWRLACLRAVNLSPTTPLPQDAHV